MSSALDHSTTSAPVMVMVMVMVFNATFNNISGLSWRSVLLVEETGENHRSVTIYWPILSYNKRGRGRFNLIYSNIIISLKDEIIYF